MPLRDLIRELSAGHHELDQLEAGDDARSALRSVFSWSFRRLPASISAAFRLLSVHPSVDLTAAAMGVLVDTSSAEAQRAIDVLARAHLIEEHPPGRYTVHSLLRAYAGELAVATDADQDRRAALIRLVEHYLQALGLPAETGAAVPRIRCAGTPGLPVSPTTPPAAAGWTPSTPTRWLPSSWPAMASWENGQRSSPAPSDLLWSAAVPFWLNPLHPACHPSSAGRWRTRNCRRSGNLNPRHARSCNSHRCHRCCARTSGAGQVPESGLTRAPRQAWRRPPAQGATA